MYAIRRFLWRKYMNTIVLDTKLDFLIDNIRFVQTTRNAGDTFNRKIGKDKCIIMFVESGEMLFHFTESKKSITVSKGNLLFLPKGILYTITYTKDNTAGKSLSFDMISNSLSEKYNSPFVKADPAFADILKNITPKNINSPFILAAKIYEILHYINKESVIVPKKFRKILPALNEIQEFYFENKKISYYADMCYMGESQFRALFKEYTGKSPIEYRNLIRLSEAHKMITEHKYSVQEAAYLTGFNNMAFFYKIYNRYYK